MADGAPDFAAALTGRQVPDLAVRLDATCAVTTLRYFSADGAFAAAARAVLGAALPGTQAAVNAAGILRRLRHRWIRQRRAVIKDRSARPSHELDKERGAFRAPMVRGGERTRNTREVIGR